jgi:signal transduction histidine kinase
LNVDPLETERMRLAAAIQRELIDPLRLLLSQAAVYEQSLAGQPGARTAMGVMAALARQVLQQAHNLEEDLYPAALNSLGLEAALEMLVGRVLRASGVAIELKCLITTPRPSAALELALLPRQQLSGQLPPTPITSLCSSKASLSNSCSVCAMTVIQRC